MPPRANCASIDAHARPWWKEVFQISFRSKGTAPRTQTYDPPTKLVHPKHGRLLLVNMETHPL